MNNLKRFIFYSFVFLLSDIDAQDRIFVIPKNVEPDSEMMFLFNHNFYHDIKKDSLFMINDSNFSIQINDLLKHQTISECFVYLNNYDDSNVLNSCYSALRLIKSFLVFKGYNPHFVYEKRFAIEKIRLRENNHFIYIGVPKQIQYKKVLVLLDRLE